MSFINELGDKMSDLDEIRKRMQKEKKPNIPLNDDNF